MSKADIGLVGLAVMGENLVLNMESHGFTVAVYNRTVEKVDKFVNGKGKDKKWKYSQIEIEYGEFLKDYSKKLLDSKPKEYHRTLQELLTASGSSENIDNNVT